MTDLSSIVGKASNTRPRTKLEKPGVVSRVFCSAMAVLLFLDKLDARPGFSGEDFSDVHIRSQAADV